MNFGNEDYNSFGGIPSSIIAYSGDRARYQTYDGIYDITTTTSQQIQTLQNQIVALQTSVQSLQQSTISQIIGTNPNLLANGNCEQFTLNQPIIGTSQAGGSSEDFVIQGKCIPIFDRWYHVAELSGVNATNFKLTINQINLKDYISGGAAYDAAPRICKKGITLNWAATSGNLTLTPEHTKAVGLQITSKFGALLGIQHMIPDVTLTVGKTYSLGFWVKTSYTGSGFIRVLRQYSTNKGGGNFLTGNALERVYLGNFNFNAGWNYVSQTFTTNSSLNGNSISGLNGLVVQIGPFHYTWASTSNYTITGTIFSGYSNFEWVLTEMQLRQDTIAAKNNFPYNLREYENTRDYICATASEPASLGPVMNSLTNRTFLSSKQQFTFNQTIDVKFPSPLKQTPDLIIWNAKRNGSWPNLRGIVSTFFNEPVGAQKIQSSANKFSFNAFNVNNADLTMNIYQDSGKMYISSGPRNDYTFTVLTTTTTNYWEIPTISKSNFIINRNATFEISDATPAELYFKSCFLYPLKSGQFVAIVAEADIGKTTDNDWIDAVDYNFSALTSIPFP